MKMLSKASRWRCSERSRPAQKCLPAPASTTQRTSDSKVSNVVFSSAHNFSLKALRLSGRLRVTMAMGPWRSISKSGSVSLIVFCHWGWLGFDVGVGGGAHRGFAKRAAKDFVGRRARQFGDEGVGPRPLVGREVAGAHVTLERGGVELRIGADDKGLHLLAPLRIGHAAHGAFRARA